MNDMRPDVIEAEICNDNEIVVSEMQQWPDKRRQLPIHASPGTLYLIKDNELLHYMVTDECGRPIARSVLPFDPSLQIIQDIQKNWGIERVVRLDLYPTLKSELIYPDEIVTKKSIKKLILRLFAFCAAVVLIFVLYYDNMQNAKISLFNKTIQQAEATAVNSDHLNKETFSAVSGIAGALDETVDTVKLLDERISQIERQLRSKRVAAAAPQKSSMIESPKARKTPAAAPVVFVPVPQYPKQDAPAVDMQSNKPEESMGFNAPGSVHKGM